MPSLATLVGLVVTLSGLAIGLRPLNDNSFLTHLATAQRIWDSGHIPRSDPYSFTAPGHSWTVQSWFASVVYGAVDRLGGTAGLVVLTGLLTALAAGLLWALSRPAGSLLGRLVLVAPAMAVGTLSYGPRPLMFGLILFSVALLAAEGRLDPRWLIPAFWLWVNTHGSFPLGLLALGLLAAGRLLDRSKATVELSALRYAAIGTIVGAVNPLGPRLLVFPVELLRRQDVLSSVVEWAAPKFQATNQRAFLVLLMMAILLVTRRPSWRSALPMAVFAMLGLTSARNLSIAAVMCVLTAAPGIRGLGSLNGAERRPIHRPMVAVLVAVGAMLVVAAPQRDTLALDAYPVEAVTFAAEHRLLDGGARIAAPDFVGNYLELRYQGKVPVFIDDRFDMYPDSVIDDYETLLRAGPGWQDVLDRWQISVIVWRVDEPLTQLLELSEGWDVEYRDERWMVAVPN